MFDNLHDWASTDKWKRNQALIDLNMIPEEYEVAIAAVLGAAIEGILVENESEMLPLI